MDWEAAIANYFSGRLGEENKRADQIYSTENSKEPEDPWPTGIL
jgi:hypothetical protein